MILVRAASFQVQSQELNTGPSNAEIPAFIIPLQNQLWHQNSVTATYLNVRISKDFPMTRHIVKG